MWVPCETHSNIEMRSRSLFQFQSFPEEHKNTLELVELLDSTMTRFRDRIRLVLQRVSACAQCRRENFYKKSAVIAYMFERGGLTGSWTVSISARGMYYRSGARFSHHLRLLMWSRMFSWGWSACTLIASYRRRYWDGRMFRSPYDR